MWISNGPSIEIEMSMSMISGVNTNWKKNVSWLHGLGKWKLCYAIQKNSWAKAQILWVKWKKFQKDVEGLQCFKYIIWWTWRLQ